MPPSLTVCAVAAAALLLLGCTDTPSSPSEKADVAVGRLGGERQYILAGPTDKLPVALDHSVHLAGGRLAASYPQVGLAIARSGSADFASRARRIAGIQHAIEDRRRTWQPPARSRRATSPAQRVRGAAAPQDGAALFGFQWAPRAIHAPAAWAAGQLGQGARVAILDGGIWAPHPDLAPNLDVGRAVSFATDADGNPTDWDQDVGEFWHGTHVAGIVAGAGVLGTIGIAPRATIVPVKVLHHGSGSFGGLIQGILYASAPIPQGGGGAHVINMSLGANVERRGSDAGQLASFLSRVTGFARQQGALLIASAGNSAIDLDHTGSLISVPAQSVGVLAISATGPVNFAGGGTDFDRPASYSNFGQSAIDLAGPGGDFTLFPNADWFMDMVLSTDLQGWSFSAGTSMAAPTVSGVAALIVGRHGPLGPPRLEGRLLAAADDLGKPGNDDHYGGGRVNARKAVH